MPKSIRQYSKSLSIRDVARVIGKIVSSLSGTSYGPLYYRALDRDKTHALKLNKGNFDAQMILSSNIERGSPTLQTTTDASSSCLGAECQGISTGEQWSFVEAQQYINYLELFAAFLGLQTFAMNKYHMHIRLRLDTTTGVSVINHMGTSHSDQCNKLCKTIWEWCIQQHIWISAACLPGLLNTVAETRRKSKSSSTATKPAGGTPVTSQSKPTGVSLTRERLDQHGLSSAIKEILMSSWRSGTRKQYSTYLSRWERYYEENQLSKLNPGLNGAIEFLTFLFESGWGYSALNTARSALSAILTLFNGIKFGEHPLVSRFLKGVYEQRPALPRYKAIWNVGEVLNYLTTLKQVPELSLKDLTLKLTMLLCLLTAQRCQTVPLLGDLKFIQELEGKYHITVQQKLKQSRPGQHLDPSVLLEFVPDRKLCVVTHLW